jgi:D-amino-acid dehydrogenase
VLFPALAKIEPSHRWAGLRPATPSNIPCIGKTRLKNVYVNTGHGTLGWTLACGSGSLLADIVSGKTPQVSFRTLP